MRQCDVAIVGAGPAGSAAAIHLARAGLDVVVADRAMFPRDKTCGDGITTLALRELEALGFDPANVASWTEVRTLQLSSPARRVRRYELPRDAGTYAAVAPRLELDAALVALATASGATVLQGHAIVGADEQNDRVSLQTKLHGTIEARYAIGADGMWSPLRKYLGVARSGYLGEWHAFRAYFSNVTSAAARDFFVWFEPDLLPGYVWSFPLTGGRANVGFGVRRGGARSAAEMRSLWSHLLQRPHITAALGPVALQEAPQRAWPIPAAVTDVSAATRRTLFVGDAMAAADVMTGEGIGQALLTARWAAEAVLAGGPTNPEVAVARYEHELRRELVPDHRMAAALERALSSSLGAEAAMALAGANAWTRRNFVRWLFEDYPRGIVLTPRRVAPGVFTRPGAFAQYTRD